MISEELYNFLQKFNSLDVRIIRYNLQQACSKLYNNYNGRSGMLKVLDGISESTFNAMLNSSCESKIDLEKFIKIIGRFNLNVDEILTDESLLPEKENDNKKWTNELKKEFINYYNENGINKTASRYNLKPNSVETYYKIFNKN